MESFTSVLYDYVENDTYDFSLNDSEILYGDIEASSTMHVVSMVIYSTTLLFGTVGNGLVIFLTGFQMKKTVTTMWYLNLALADFIYDLSLSSELLYFALHEWTLGWLFCKLDTVVSFLNMFASVFFLTAISVDRCVSVVCPIWSLNHRTLRLASLIVGLIWMMALALSTPYLYFRDMEYDTDDSVKCSYSFGLEEASSHQSHLSMVVTEFVIGFFIPFNIILACYCIIVFKLRRKLFGQSGRSFKIMVAVVVAFFCCWFPHHFFSILENLVDESFEMSMVIDIGLPLANGLVCLNSCLNPFLYAFVGSDFRKNSWRSFLSAFKSAFSENWATSSFSSNRNSGSTSGIVEYSMV
ncbi:PREDICTED: C3a anaphylatoxin chemotactic receptor-like [Thamnophis sirtalis]|uniref:C3a anaphylatoxin chemotactic receptor-like n=1 Tax=Thamnophis sirtalis TaxID=35019 RepID=A0A6I9XUX9_9SAUR|nr:PREDICTED: C3a anaphylatoxin chemotactic receptor-like [Thamnophis sirtalis]